MRPDNAHMKHSETRMKKLKKEDGFTLIEVLIALTIFAVGLLAVAAMQNSAILMNSNAGKLTNLSTWGMDKMEELSSLPYSDPWLEDLGDPPSGTDTNGNAHSQALDNGDYTVSWTVIDDDPVPNVKRITVRVTGRGKSTSISFIKPNV